MNIIFRDISGRTILIELEKESRVFNVCKYLSKKLHISSDKIFLLSPKEGINYYSNNETIEHVKEENPEYVVFTSLYQNTITNSNENQTELGLKDKSYLTNSIPIKALNRFVSFNYDNNLDNPIYKKYSQCINEIPSDLQQKVDEISILGYEIEDIKEALRAKEYNVLYAVDLLVQRNSINSQIKKVSKPQLKSQEQSQSQPQFQALPQSQPQFQALPQSRPQLKFQKQPQPQTQTQLKSQKQPQPQFQVLPQSQTQLKSQKQPQPQTQPQLKSQKQPQPQLQFQPKFQFKSQYQFMFQQNDHFVDSNKNSNTASLQKMDKIEVSNKQDNNNDSSNESNQEINILAVNHPDNNNKTFIDIKNSSENNDSIKKPSNSFSTSKPIDSNNTFTNKKVDDLKSFDTSKNTNSNPTNYFGQKTSNKWGSSLNSYSNNSSAWGSALNSYSNNSSAWGSASKDKPPVNSNSWGFSNTNKLNSQSSFDDFKNESSKSTSTNTSNFSFGNHFSVPKNDNMKPTNTSSSFSFGTAKNVGWGSNNWNNVESDIKTKWGSPSTSNNKSHWSFNKS